MTHILGEKWVDLGSDVDWYRYGGVWGRPMPTPDEPDRWAVIRLDTEVDDGMAYAVAVHVRVSQVTPQDPETCGMPVDGLDEYGEPIPVSAWIEAYIRTWGASGPAGGETFADRRADRARAKAARHLS